MFVHQKQYLRPVRVYHPNPRWAQMILEGFGGDDSEAAAVGTYMAQRFNTTNPDLQDLLLDIATEELSHWEMIGEMVRQCGGQVRWVDAAGTPFCGRAAPISGDPVADLYSNLGLEMRARALYLRLAAAVEDPGLQDTLLFLGAREEAHAVSFARAIEAIAGSLSLPQAWEEHPYLKLSPGTFAQQAAMVPSPPPPLTFPPSWPYPAAQPEGPRK